MRVTPEQARYAAAAVRAAVRAGCLGSGDLAWEALALVAWFEQREANMADEKDDVIGWAVVELMGHRRLTAYVRPVEVAGKGFLRLDIPGPETAGESGPFRATQIVSPDAVYCITPTTMDLAVRGAGVAHVAPLTRWELAPDPKAKALQSAGDRRDWDECDRLDGVRGQDDDDLPV